MVAASKPRFPVTFRDLVGVVARRPFSSESWITAGYVFFGRLHYRRRAEAIDGMLATANRRMGDRESIGRVAEVLPRRLTLLASPDNRTIFGVEVQWPNNVETIYGHTFPYYRNLVRIWGMEYAVRRVENVRA